MTARAYYNDVDPYVCRWLENLIKAGLLPEGDVDNRSIRAISGDDLAGYTQVHLFAGIGGWPIGLRRAGWPVWTGSCPCQPFSRAGHRRGNSDARNLWPEMLRLVQECRPAIVLGEQVSGHDGYDWFEHVRDGLEGSGYAVGAVDFPLACLGAPTIRPRIYWVADAGGLEQQGGFGKPEPEDRNDPFRGRTARFWEAVRTLPDDNGELRRFEPRIFPLVARFPGRTAQVRAAGNAVSPEAVKHFVTAVMEMQ